MPRRSSADPSGFNTGNNALKARMKYLARRDRLATGAA
jgi:hypothetical protein